MSVTSASRTALRYPLRRLLRPAAPRSARMFASAPQAKTLVKIMEVGPRDGLQNEKGVVPVDVKVELINRLGEAGLKHIEAGSFVSPKWVPQMGGTAEVISQMERLPGVHYPVLVPNQRGLDNLSSLLAEYASSPSAAAQPPPTDEIAIFTAATDAFCQANTNTTVAGSLARLAPVARAALAQGLRVRGYVSVVITCPYSGQVDYGRVREVAEALLAMGCYEVSLGDTVGTGTPAAVSEMLREVTKTVPVEKLAGHFHDTFGTGVANVMAALDLGVRTIDSSIGGLGGCPYSPGATGNVATEDVLYALQGSQYTAGPGVSLDKLVETGWWISEQLGRETVSRAGKALRLKKLQEHADGPKL
ncbi:aldolase [Athelia psychrophila]|uniref:hydroxymethylglutaryl-CoA lyase n=1 Tax=Athelia psychrophila TaxID=1759441 RepID=A0A166FEC5_9AGAM|nr:aldolase [Fibularhizoctonia sp. CBS 109695]